MKEQIPTNNLEKNFSDHEKKEITDDDLEDKLERISVILHDLEYEQFDRGGRPIKSEVKFAQKIHELKTYGNYLKEGLKREKFVRAVYDILSEYRHYNISDEFPNEAGKYLLNIVEKSIPEIQEKTKFHSRLSKEEALYLYRILSIYGNKEQKKSAVTAMMQNIEEIEALLETNFYWAQGFLWAILKEGDAETDKTVRKLLEKTIERNKTFNDKYDQIINLCFETSNLDLKIYGWQLLNSKLKGLGLPGDYIIKAWINSAEPEQLYNAIYKNLLIITKLENNQPGICKFLYEKFGIADFGRYPAELLIKQKEEFKDTGKPYGVIIYPYDDWNGSFYNDKNIFEKLFDDLAGEFSLRVYECKSKIGLVRALIKSDKRYNPPGGKGHKISLAIIGGHGEKNAIQFGKSAKDTDSLYSRDLMGEGANKSSKFFAEQPTFILASCSTGVENGIGQELSEKLGAKVIAPKKPTNLREINVAKKPGNKFRFNAKYTEEEKGEYLQGGLMRK